MTSIGTGYDLSASTYSPDGRIFQVCTASTSALIVFLTFNTRTGGICEQSSRQFWVSIWLAFLLRTLIVLLCRRTAIGLRVRDGVVLAVEKLVHSKLLVPEANRRIQIIDRHIGLVSNLS